MILTSHNRAIACEMVMNADDGMILELRKPKRSTEQNRKYWTILSDISEQQVHKKVYEPSIWHIYFKQLFLPDHIHELPDGSLHVSPPSSTKMTLDQFSEYMEKVMQWALEHGVKLSEEK